MNRAAMVLKLADHIAGIASHPLGVAGFMIEDEIACGRAVMQPGSKEPFEVPAEDWTFPSVISHDGREARLVAILAQRPGTGALRRLVQNIETAGLRPVIVCPVGPGMLAILKHWNWRRRTVGRGWERVEEWRPPVQNRSTVTGPGTNQKDRP